MSCGVKALPGGFGGRNSLALVEMVLDCSVKITPAAVAAPGDPPGLVHPTAGPGLTPQGCLGLCCCHCRVSTSFSCDKRLGDARGWRERTFCPWLLGCYTDYNVGCERGSSSMERGQGQRGAARPCRRGTGKGSLVGRLLRTL